MVDQGWSKMNISLRIHKLEFIYFEFILWYRNVSQMKYFLKQFADVMMCFGETNVPVQKYFLFLVIPTAHGHKFLCVKRSKNIND